MDRDDPDRFRFFATMKRAEKERLGRFIGEERTRFMLRCASGGGMQHPSRKRKAVSLAELNWMIRDEKA